MEEKELQNESSIPLNNPTNKNSIESNGMHQKLSNKDLDTPATQQLNSKTLQDDKIIRRKSIVFKSPQSSNVIQNSRKSNLEATPKFNGRNLQIGLLQNQNDQSLTKKLDLKSIRDEKNIKPSPRNDNNNSENEAQSQGQNLPNSQRLEVDSTQKPQEKNLEFPKKVEAEPDTIENEINSMFNNNNHSKTVTKYQKEKTKHDEKQISGLMMSDKKNTNPFAEKTMRMMSPTHENKISKLKSPRTIPNENFKRSSTYGIDVSKLGVSSTKVTVFLDQQQSVKNIGDKKIEEICENDNLSNDKQGVNINSETKLQFSEMTPLNNQKQNKNLLVVNVVGQNDTNSVDCTPQGSPEITPNMSPSKIFKEDKIRTEKSSFHDNTNEDQANDIKSYIPSLVYEKLQQKDNNEILEEIKETKDQPPKVSVHKTSINEDEEEMKETKDDKPKVKAIYQQSFNHIGVVKKPILNVQSKRVFPSKSHIEKDMPIIVEKDNSVAEKDESVIEKDTSAIIQEEPVKDTPRGGVVDTPRGSAYSGNMILSKYNNKYVEESEQIDNRSYISENDSAENNAPLKKHFTAIKKQGELNSQISHVRTPKKSSTWNIGLGDSKFDTNLISKLKKQSPFGESSERDLNCEEIINGSKINENQLNYKENNKCESENGPLEQSLKVSRVQSHRNLAIMGVRPSNYSIDLRRKAMGIAIKRYNPNESKSTRNMTQQTITQQNMTQQNDVLSFQNFGTPWNYDVRMTNEENRRKLKLENNKARAMLNAMDEYNRKIKDVTFQNSAVFKKSSKRGINHKQMDTSGLEVYSNSLRAQNYRFDQTNKESHEISRNMNRRQSFYSMPGGGTDSNEIDLENCSNDRVHHGTHKAPVDRSLLSRQILSVHRRKTRRPSLKRSSNNSAISQLRSKISPPNSAKSQYSQYSNSKSQHVTNETTEIKENEEPIYKMLETVPFNIISGIFTFYALFGDDFKFCCFGKSADIYFDIITLIVIIGFFIEIGLLTYARKQYLCSFFFWMDFIATMTLFVDLTWISENYLHSSDIDDLTITRTTRASRIGSKLNRIFRLQRMLRLIRVSKAYKQRSEIKKTRMKYHGQGTQKVDFESKDVTSKTKDMTTKCNDKSMYSYAGQSNDKPQSDLQMAPIKKSHTDNDRQQDQNKKQSKRINFTNLFKKIFGNIRKNPSLYSSSNKTSQNHIRVEIPKNDNQNPYMNNKLEIINEDNSNYQLNPSKNSNFSQKLQHTIEPSDQQIDEDSIIGIPRPKPNFQNRHDSGLSNTLLLPEDRDITRKSSAGTRQQENNIDIKNQRSSMNSNIDDKDSSDFYNEVKEVVEEKFKFGNYADGEINDTHSQIEESENDEDVIINMQINSKIYRQQLEKFMKEKFTLDHFNGMKFEENEVCLNDEKDKDSAINIKSKKRYKGQSEVVMKYKDIEKQKYFEEQLVEVKKKYFTLPMESVVGKTQVDNGTKIMTFTILQCQFTAFIFQSWTYYPENTGASFNTQLLNLWIDKNLISQPIYTTMLDSWKVDYYEADYPIVHIYVPGTTNFTNDTLLTELRNSEIESEETYLTDNSFQSVRISYSIRKQVIISSLLSILRTFWVCLVLIIAIMTMENDFNQLMIYPIERIQNLLFRQIKDPRSVKNESEQLVDTWWEEQQKKIKNGGIGSVNDIVQIEFAIMRIVELLLMNFGSVGNETVSQFLVLDVNTDHKNYNYYGKKIYAVYSCCKIVYGIFLI